MARSPARTDSILDAAQELFLKHGLRGTSMEAIAARAGVAKPTLYAYFPDKSAVFGALVERLVAGWRVDFAAALDGDGDIVERVAAALSGKHKAAWRLLEGSPHAAELYDEHGTPQILEFENEIAALVERELAAAGVERPRLVAQLLLAASYGVSRKAQSSAEIGPAVRLLVERLVRS